MQMIVFVQRIIETVFELVVVDRFTCFDWM